MTEHVVIPAETLSTPQNTRLEHGTQNTYLLFIDPKALLLFLVHLLQILPIPLPCAL
jgi:hypothetical protein